MISESDERFMDDQQCARELTRRTRIRTRPTSSDQSVRRFCTVISNTFPRLRNRLRNLDISPANQRFKIGTDMPLPLAAEADRVRGGRADATGPVCSAAP